jgi:hypothetical protein
MADGAYSSAYSSAYDLFDPQVTDLSVTIVADSLHATVERLFGYSVAEDAGSTAVVNLRAGSVSGQIVVGPLSFAANESKIAMLEKNVFWEFPGGLHMEEVSGSVHGVFHVRNV